MTTCDICGEQIEAEPETVLAAPNGVVQEYVAHFDETDSLEGWTRVVPAGAVR